MLFHDWDSVPFLDLPDFDLLFVTLLVPDFSCVVTEQVVELNVVANGNGMPSSFVFVGIEWVFSCDNKRFFAGLVSKSFSSETLDF